MVIGTAIRLAFVLLGSGTTRFTNVDTESYTSVARHLPGALWSPSAAVLDYSLQRTPVYPIFIAVVSPGGTHLTAIAVAQCLVGGALNVWLCSVLARRIVGPAAAGPAALLLAIDPISVAHSSLVVSDTVFTTVLLLGVLACERWWTSSAATDAHRSVVGWAATSGAALGIAALTRPVMLYAIPLLLAVMAVTRRGRRAVFPIAAATMAALLLVGAWFVRNEAATDHLVFSTAQGQNLFDYGAAAAASEQGRMSFTTDGDRNDLVAAGDRLLAEHPGEVDETDLVQRDRDWARIGIAAIIDHPRGYVQVAAQGVARAMLGTGSTLLTSLAGAPDDGATAVVAVVAAGLILTVEYCLAVAGTFVLWRRRAWSALVLLGLPTIYYLGMSAGPQMYARFRVPIAPLLCVAAGAAVAGVVRRRRAGADSGSAAVPADD